MRRFGVYGPAAVLMFGCALLMRTRSQVAVPLAKPLADVLPQYQDYGVRNLTLSADERRVAGMNDYIARAYLRDTTIAFTTLVSYYERQTRGQTIHSPRNCLPGAGWEVMRAGTRTFSIGGKEYTVNRDVLKNHDASALVYYWYEGRGRVVASEYRVKWNLLRDAALAGHSEEALVRLVVPINAPTAQLGEGSAVLRAADARAADVVTRLITGVSEVLPHGTAVGI